MKNIRVEGRVKKVEKGPYLKEGVFECQRCGSIVNVEQDGNKLKEPSLCKSCEKKGPFKLLTSESVFVDGREITLDDGADSSKLLTVRIEGYSTEGPREGDKIRVEGVLKPVRKDKTTTVTGYVIDADSYRILTDV